ncbi:MAG: hypothetical protein HKN51_08205, partial [Saprospiraceae bacterium]|nr:hypothetical protein [Saprospiraceae bacterium]
MKIKFTQLGFFFLMVFAFAQLGAQNVNILRVNSPASITGDYPINLTTGWGQQLMTELSGTATFADDGEGTVTDGCDGTITNISGKIAFVDRGNCEFGVKALASENAGAVATIICNNVTGEFFPGVGTVGDQVSTPVAGMSLEDCMTVRTEAEGGDIDITLLYIEEPCPTPSYGPEVIWGNESGQGDFDGGLNGWTISCESDTCFGWTIDPTVLQNGSFATGVNISTPTMCNGAVVMDSDYLDNLGGGVPAIGTGICPANCVGSLISPVIDLTAITDLSGLFIEFDQQTRQFASTYQVILSKNGGVSWPDT